MSKLVSTLMASLSLLVLTAGANAADFGPLSVIQDFVGRSDIMTNLSAMESSGLMSHTLQKRPWSDTYWPDRTGSVAAPYAASGYINIPLSWSMHRSFINDMLDDFNRGKLSESDKDKLGPATKYDLLLGDRDLTFTRNIMKMVDEKDDGHYTAMWSGICHGWSPASLSLDRQLHAVDMETPSGEKVRFYPSDIKALASMLWANAAGAQNNVKFVGKICQKAKTNNVGRITNEECFDVNPAMLHLLAVNQIGRSERGFVMDRSYEKMIMNQPTFSYTYEYFNPATNDSARSIAEATQYLDGRKFDPYKQFRSPKAKKIVGVKIKLLYGKETQPNHELTDSERNDKTNDLELKYDLELDEYNNIVGGEWRKYENIHRPNLADNILYSHPDIIWAPAPRGNPDYSYAWSQGDNQVDVTAWNGEGPVPESWRRGALVSAQETQVLTLRGRQTTVARPQPLALIVQWLITKARY